MTINVISAMTTVAVLERIIKNSCTSYYCLLADYLRVVYVG